MKKEPERKRLKREMRSLLKSMDYASEQFRDREDVDDEQVEIFAQVYQHLGWAWELLALQCKHWDGFKKTRGGEETCRICGTVKGAEERFHLLPREGTKKIGRKLRPTSRKIFKNKKHAAILDDSIVFHGASLRVDVHNAYKSRLFKGDREINVADDRAVTLRERGIKCYIDQHLTYVKVPARGKKGKKKFGGFPWEIKKKDLKNFPVIFDFDEKYRFLGLTILG